MKETTLIIDEATGALTVEGLNDETLNRIAGDLLPQPAHVNCARPVNVPPAISASKNVGKDEPQLRVFRVYHGSVVEGFGRRSVVQLQGCERRCVGCYVPETHDTHGGVLMGIIEVVELLLDAAGEPRDGVTILGGEPFLQPDGLAALMRELKARDIHLTLYSGYTLEELRARSEPGVHETLALADVLIDSPFVSALAHNAGEWRGSTNQRIIHHPSRYQS